MDTTEEKGLLVTDDEVMTAKQAAKMVHTSEAALAQDRYRGRGIPYIKYAARVRYLRSDVIAYMQANRVDTGGAA